MYDAMADAVVMDRLMTRHHYYYDHGPGYVSHGSGIAGLAWLGAIMLLVILGVAVIAARSM
jgi:hypothetical protein